MSDKSVAAMGDMGRVRKTECRAMEHIHPERAQDNGLEPTVGEQLRLGEFLKGLERANEGELRELCRHMAQQVLVVYPAAIRFLVREAAKNPSGQPWSEEASGVLLKALTSAGAASYTGDDADVA